MAKEWPHEPAGDAGNIISGGTKGGVKPEGVGDSAMKNTEVGTGSRPVPSRYKIETSAPENAREMKNPPPGWLK